MRGICSEYSKSKAVNAPITICEGFVQNIQNQKQSDNKKSQAKGDLNWMNFLVNVPGSTINHFLENIYGTRLSYLKNTLLFLSIYLF